MIFDIQRFSLHDGAGIRTLVFFKGCPLRCQWCSNPESQEYGKEVMYDSGRCLFFGDCMKAVPGAIFHRNGDGLFIDRKSLKHPELLKEICVSGALTICGEEMATKDLMEEVTKDAPFYRDSGGVTLSGGEPLAHIAEVVPLLKKLKDTNIRVNAETSLHVPWTNVQRCLEWIDTFLVDLKHTNQMKFKEFTGGNVSLVLDNLAHLSSAGARMVIRIPVIPGFNHTLEEMKAIMDHASGLRGVDEIHFLPYHTLGIEKYRMLGRAYPFPNQRGVDEQELTPYREYARMKGLKTKTGG